MQVVIDIPEETYKTISEWKEPNPKYAAEYMLYGFVKNGKQIEQEPCGDAISIDKVIEWLKNKDIIKLSTQEETARKELRELPSVSTEKTGRWKRISIDKYSEHAKYWYRCDRCGKDNLGNTDWCPNCGAKMRVEE